MNFIIVSLIVITIAVVCYYWWEMANWVRGKLCKLPQHDETVRYEGRFVTGYKCRSCDHEWYLPANEYSNNRSED